MRIVRILEKTVPMASNIRNAVINFSAMTSSIVAVVTDVVSHGKPVIGYGFNSNGRYGQGGILRDRILPRLEAADPSSLLTDDESNIDPQRCWAVMMSNEKPGGHGERSVAVGTVDMALWDAVAKIEERPLAAVLADRFGTGTPQDDVAVYAAGGYYSPGKGTSGLETELKSYLDRGYDAVKMKVGGASLDEDLRRIEAALGVVGDAHRLAVDANARFERDEAIRFAEAVAPLGLKWYEEPCDPLDYDAMAAVCAATETVMATGENLFSMTDARNLIRYGGMNPARDILQFDPVLAYGLVEYLRIVDMLTEHGWPLSACVPHGGHQFALHIAAGLGLGGNESYPDVFHPFGGFADDEPVKDGRVRIPDAPGIGFELKRELIAVFASLTT